MILLLFMIGLEKIYLNIQKLSISDVANLSINETLSEQLLHLLLLCCFNFNLYFRR